MLLPLLEQHGWKAVVLCVRSDFVDGTQEPDLLRTIPASVEVVECRAIPAQSSRRVGIGSLALRAGFFLRSAGERLLRDRAFDLVFFSTTEFLLLALGPRWLREYGVPFVVDLHDPWVNPYYEENRLPPPGGHLKHAIHQAAARYLEKRVLCSAAQIITVSPRYPITLVRRYPSLPETKFSVIPFGGAERDFEMARDTAQSAFTSGDGRRHWVYAGAVVPGMYPAIAAFFDAFRWACEAGIVEPDTVRVHFIGTDYAPGSQARRRVMPLAERCGVAQCVEEHPHRIAYLETLRCLLDADALLMFGSNEPGYTASKLITYILAYKPLLTIFHEESSVTRIVRETNAATLVAFGSATTADEIARSVFDAWLAPRAFEKEPVTNSAAVKAYTAAAMTQRVVAVFDRGAISRRDANS
jgi:hypothetical protein